MKEYKINVYDNPNVLPMEDAVVGDLMKNGDTIVVCAACKKPMRKSSYEINGHQCFCGSNKLLDINDKVLSEITGSEIHIKHSPDKSNAQTNSVAAKDKPLIPNSAGWIIAIMTFILVGVGIIIGFKNMYGNSSTDTYTSNYSGINAEGTNTEYEENVSTEAAVVKYTVESIKDNAHDVGNASIITYSGNINSEEDKDNYSYTVPITGRYRFEISGITNSKRVSIRLYNQLGECVDEDDYCSNGEGLTVYDMNKGEQYVLVISYCDAKTPYVLSIGEQKPPVNTDGYNIINDSIEYVDQRNVYRFKPSVDGRYRFDISDLHANKRVEIYLFNNLEECIASDDYCSNGEGLTVTDLEAGEEYELQVRYCDGLSDYTLHIGRQKECVDISDKDVVNDSIQYVDQKNIYAFTPSSNCATFTISGLEENARVELLVFNYLDECVGEDDYVSNGEGLEFDDLEVGKEYEVQVRYCDRVSNYTLNVE